MFGRGFISALAALSCGLLLCVPAAAQRGARGGRGRMPRAERGENNQKKTPIDEFETLSPAEQQKALKRLPEAQRQQLQARLDRFNALPREQQQTLKSMYNRLHQLPPQRQEAVRKAINKFSQLPGDRQQAIREELRSSEALSSEQRQQELDSPASRLRFSRKEQEILRDMSALLPER
jgi:phage-related protein